MQLTKTFIQHLWYRRRPGDSPGVWQQLPEAQAEDPIDDQVTAWVQRTGHLIVNPGQLGIHTQWYDRDLTIKCVTLGLVVLYQPSESYEQPAESRAPSGSLAALPVRGSSIASDASSSPGGGSGGSASVPGGPPGTPGTGSPAASAPACTAFDPDPDPANAAGCDGTCECATPCAHHAAGGHATADGATRRRGLSL